MNTLINIWILCLLKHDYLIYGIIVFDLSRVVFITGVIVDPYSLYQKVSLGPFVIGYRYIYTLEQPCCTSQLLWRCSRVSDCHQGDPDLIPVRVRSEDIFLHLSHFRKEGTVNVNIADLK